MATIAAILDRLVVKGVDRVGPRHQEDFHQIRPFASEDIFFFAKPIDNSRIIRQADPEAGRAQFWMIGGSLMGAIALVALMLPALYSAVAGYKIEALRQERSRLTNERTSLELAEEKILTPRHLEELAKKQSFVDPDPMRVVYLEGHDRFVAKRTAQSHSRLQ